MKKIFLITFVFLNIIGCGYFSEKPHSTNHVSSVKILTAEPFDIFLKKFSKDDTFRKQRTFHPFINKTIESNSDDEEEIAIDTLKEFPFRTLDTSSMDMDKGTLLEIMPVSYDTTMVKLNIDDTGILFYLYFVRNPNSLEWYAISCENWSN